MPHGPAKTPTWVKVAFFLACVAAFLLFYQEVIIK